MTIADQLIEKGFQDGIEKGFQKEIARVNRIASSMLSDGKTVEYVSEVTGLTINEIYKLQSQFNV